jgi:hypothetical protein
VLPHGVNLPWLRYGGDFGANAWSSVGGLTTRDLADLHRSLGAAAGAGAEVVRWFLLCDGRAGITFDASGTPRALQPVVLDDLGLALDALRTHGLRMVPVLFDFTWADARRVVNDVPLGGHTHVLKDPIARHALWTVVDSLVSTVGDHDGIAMWDLWNEPDWMVSRWRAPGRRLTTRQLRRCLAELILHVRWHSTHPITVGLASTGGLPICRGLGLDVLQVHWYDHLERRTPLGRRPRVPWSDAPLLLGEYPTRGSARLPAHIVETARTAGYQAAWPWSLRADDHCSEEEGSLHGVRCARAHHS